MFIDEAAFADHLKKKVSAALARIAKQQFVLDDAKWVTLQWEYYHRASSSELQQSALKRETAQAFWQATHLLLLYYRHDHNWPQGNVGKPTFPLPFEFAGALADMTGELASGRLPAAMDVVVRQGQPSYGPMERLALTVACTYIARARAGQITDKSPIMTVAKIFGVNKQTVYDWIKVFDAVEFLDDATLPAALEEMAASYKLGGRSAQSIAKRQSKRSRRV